MSIINKILIGSSLLKSKITHKRIPLIVNWAITGRCNLRCSHCYGSYGVVQKDELSLDVVKKTVDELKKIGTRRITIEGGEPLLREDIKEIVNYIYEKDIEISLCTNGILVGKYIDFIKGKVDLTVLSVEGREEFHDLIRGKGNFKKVINALEICKKNNVRTLIFSSLIDKNIRDIDFLIDTAKRYNVYIAFNLAVAKIKENGGREKLDKISDEEYRAAFLKILEHKKNGAPVFYSEDNFRQIINWPSFAKEILYEEDLKSFNKKDNFFLAPCYAGINYCYIECTGDVYPCYQMVGILDVRNIREDGFKKAFNHLSETHFCKHCYNVTLSELNLQCGFNLKAVFKVIKNYITEN
ncbi:MAG: radical SAM protein [bacterium]